MHTAPDLDSGSSGVSGRNESSWRNDWNSLAVSPDQARFKMELLKLGRKLAFDPLCKILSNTALERSLFPVFIDLSYIEAEKQEIQSFENRLIAAFEETPLEDGLNHPAEKIIDEAFRRIDRRRVFEWLGVLTVDNTRPVLASLVLRCLGRK